MEWNWGKCNETGLEDRVGGRPRGLPVDSGHKPMSDSYRMEAKESVKEVYSSHVVTPDEVTYSSHYWEKGLSHTGQALRECGALGTHCTLQLENHGMCTHTHTHTRIPPTARLRSQTNQLHSTPEAQVLVQGAGSWQDAGAGRDTTVQVSGWHPPAAPRVERWGLRFVPSLGVCSAYPVTVPPWAPDRNQESP